MRRRNLIILISSLILALAAHLWIGPARPPASFAGADAAGAPAAK